MHVSLSIDGLLESLVCCIIYIQDTEEYGAWMDSGCDSLPECLR